MHRIVNGFVCEISVFEYYYVVACGDVVVGAVVAHALAIARLQLFDLSSIMDCRDSSVLRLSALFGSIGGTRRGNMHRPERQLCV